MTIGSSGSWKTHAFLNLINEQDDIVKFYLYAKDLSEPKNEFLIKKREDVGMKYCNDANAFIECSNRWMTFIRILMTTTQAEKEKS